MDVPLTDLGYLERFCKGDRSRVEKYIRLYVEGSPALFAHLAEKTAAGDAEGLAVAAHSLRPQVNYMGARELFDLLTAVEQLARSEGADACSGHVEAAIELNGRVLAALRPALGRS